MILHIDLSAQRVSSFPLPPSYSQLFLGGIGLAVRLLWDYTPVGVDPFDPANPLVFAPGPLTGTLAPASAKHAVAAKSPLTGFVGDSLSGGAWSLALKRTGCDALVITGAASELTYIFIDDGRVHFRRADSLRGRGCYETEQAIRQELGDSTVRIAAIGPAGERLVRYAAIGNDYSRQAGRTGLGAIMGAKKLKAIAVRGTRPVAMGDGQALEALCLELYRRAQGPSTEKYRVLGTPGNVLMLNRLAALPTRNFQQSTFEWAEQVSGELLYDRNLVKITACATCPIACDHHYRGRDEPYAATHASLDYETLYALGPLCGVDHPSAIIRAAELCDHYGLDTISTGVSIAWAMECFERGILKRGDFDGLEPRFGNQVAMVTLVERIGRREGLGDVLAEGVKRAAAAVGGGSEQWAMHAKGLELPGYEPRAMKTLALGYAVGTRGACHNRSAAYEVDMSARVDRLQAGPERGAMAMEQEDFAAVLDSLGLCKFLRRCFTDFYAEAAALYTLATGLEMDAQGLKRVGERVSNLKKAYNIRQGWSRHDDWLPPRVFREPLPTGVARGAVLTESELNMMIDAYYRARGWTAEGLIPKEKLRELSLEDLIQEEVVGATPVYSL